MSFRLRTGNCCESWREASRRRNRRQTLVWGCGRWWPKACIRPPALSPPVGGAQVTLRAVLAKPRKRIFFAPLTVQQLPTQSCNSSCASDTHKNCMPPPPRPRPPLHIQPPRPPIALPRAFSLPRCLVAKSVRETPFDSRRSMASYLGGCVKVVEAHPANRLTIITAAGNANNGLTGNTAAAMKHATKKAPCLGDEASYSFLTAPSDVDPGGRPHPGSRRRSGSPAANRELSLAERRRVP